MKKKHYIVIFILLLLVGGATYRLGIKVTKDAFSDGLASTQAMLAFNHLKRYEELSDCLSNKKIEAAALKLNMSIVNEKELIAEFLQSHNDAELNEYITIRYPQGDIWGQSKNS